MTTISARCRELTQFMSDHIFGDKNRHVLLAVMDCNGQADKLRKDGGTTDQVLIGRLSFDSRAASTFFNRCRSINGPFFKERGTAFTSM